MQRHGRPGKAVIIAIENVILLFKENTSQAAELAVLYDSERINLTRSNHTTVTGLEVIRAIK